MVTNRNTTERDTTIIGEFATKLADYRRDNGDNVREMPVSLEDGVRLASAFGLDVWEFNGRRLHGVIINVEGVY